MKATAHHLTILLASVGLAAAQSGASKSGARHPSESAAVEAPEVQIQAKTVHYADKDVVRLKTKVRYTTLVVLPKNEQILDFTCGDKDFWGVGKPAWVTVNVTGEACPGVVGPTVKVHVWGAKPVLAATALSLSV